MNKKSKMLCMAGSAALICIAMTVRAISPYTVDANTLHLWHFDDPAAEPLPVISAAATGQSSIYNLNVTNQASLMAPAYSTALGGSLDTQADETSVALNDSSIYMLDQELTGADGAFSYEALVYPTFDPSAAVDGRVSPMEIICFDSESVSSTNRFFQLRLQQPLSNEQWAVEFANIGSYIEGEGSNIYTLVETVDDFSSPTTVADNYTYTVMLTVSEGAHNEVEWDVSTGALQLNTTNYAGIEQSALIRNGLALNVGEEVQAELVHNGGNRAFGLFAGAQPVAGTRANYVTIYTESSGNIYSRGFDGSSEYGNYAFGSATYDKVFIARPGENTYELGYYAGDVRTVVVTRMPENALDAQAVGIYADVRVAGVLGSVDNLALYEKTPVGIPPTFGESFQAPLPVSGDHAAAASNWYHVAVTYNGNENTADNLKMYWTKLSPSATTANLIGSFQMTNDIANATIDTIGEFAVGNECRGPSSENFVGLLDEVRVSEVARTAGEFNLTGTPYSEDGSTLLLFHFDETHDPIPDVVNSVATDEVSSNPLDLIAINNPVFETNAYTGFGSAIGFDDINNPGNRLAAYEDTPISMSNIVDAVTGAFTLEALIQPGWDGQAPQDMEIICTDDENTRPFQWRFQSGGTTLRFHAIATLLDTPLDVEVPTTGPHAIAQGAWFHVAFAYNGNEGETNNVTVYWTRLDSEAAQANVLTNFTVAVDLVNPAHNGELCIGNELRDWANQADEYDDEEFIGVIDEVRISKVARPATQFVFADALILDPYGITSIAVSGGNATLTWESQSGATYSILRKTALTESWTTVSSGIGSAGDGTTSGAVPVSGAAAEFYQVSGE